MAIGMVPYEPRHATAVKAFNERLRAAGLYPGRRVVEGGKA
jgi:hypothetical protein